MKLLKKLLLATLITLVALVVAPKIVPEWQNTVEAASVKISSKKKTMYKGYTYTLKVTGTKKKVTWTSSDKSKATVNSKGKVYAKKNGKVTITAKVGNKKYTCKVTIKNKPYKLKQFSTTFYDLKDVAVKHKYIGDIKNYGDYRYDLDGDGKKDKIIAKRVQNDEDLYYSVRLNNVEFKKVDAYTDLYIVDLNKNDKKMELVLEYYYDDAGDSFGYGYDIYQKNGNKMKKIADTEKLDYPAESIKVNQQGKIVVRDAIEEVFSPYIVSKYYELNKGKISKIKTLFKNVKNLSFKTTSQYGGYGNVLFTTSKKNIGATGKSQLIKKGTKFKLLSMSFIPEVEGGRCNTCKVKLSNGKTGYLYVVSTI